jgi:hypothetical protein
MPRLKLWMGLCVVAILLALPVALEACPLCAEGIANSAPDEEVNNLGAAINQSVYVMVSVPYITLAVVGFMIYRGCKKNAEYLKTLAEKEPPGSGNAGCGRSAFPG